MRVVAVAADRRARAEQPRRGAQRAGENVPQSEIALALANAVTLAQVFSVNDGVRHQWLVVSGKWHVASGKWQVASGQR